MSDLQAVERLVHPEGPVSRRSRYANIQVRVPYWEIQRFKEILPMPGALSWFIRSVIEEFNEQTGTILDEPHVSSVREYVAKLVKRRRARSRRG